MQDVLDRAAAIRLAIFDVDGVLTDGKLFFDAEGREYKSFHARDGFGIKLLRSTGVEVAVVSGRQSEVVARRMEGLGIDRVYQGMEDKLEALDVLCHELGVRPEQVAHVGDDWLDLPLMRRVGLAVVVPDAHPAIRPYAHWMTKNPGGHGAAREVCDLILRAQGHYNRVLEAYL